MNTTIFMEEKGVRSMVVDPVLTVPVPRCFCLAKILTENLMTGFNPLHSERFSLWGMMGNVSFVENLGNVPFLESCRRIYYIKIDHAGQCIDSYDAWKHNN